MTPDMTTPVGPFPDICAECAAHDEGCCPDHAARVAFKMRCPRCDKKGKYRAFMGNGRIWRITRVNGLCCY